MNNDTTSQAFFETKYRANSDPWNFETDAYEQRRYQTIIDSLDGRHFRRAFEPGCSIGILTRYLADFCDNVEATEISPTAVARAQKRCSDRLSVRIKQGALPEALPNGSLDFIVFSEIGYYFPESILRMLVDSLVERLDKGGLFLAVHWLGTSTDHLLSGDQVHDVINTASGLRRTLSRRFDHFRLEHWNRE